MIQRRQVYCVMCCPSASLERTGIEEQLKRSADYCQLFDGIWLVLTTETAEALYKRLIGCFSGNDQVVVLELGERSCSWLPQHPDANRWLQRYV